MRLAFLIGLFGVLAAGVAGATPAGMHSEAGAAPTVTVSANDADRVMVTFELGDLSTESMVIEGQSFDLISIPGGGLSGEVGAPSLPNFTRLVMIPDRAAVTVTAVAEDEEELVGLLPAPIQAEAPAGFAYDADAYAQARVAATPLVEVGNPAILRDLRVVPITFNPVRYDRATETVRVCRRMRVEVTFEGVDRENERVARSRPVTPSFDRLYREMVVNYPEANRSEMQPGTYLLICPDDATIVSLLQPLVEWRTRKGMPAVIATEAETGTSTTAIKAYIQNAYDNWSPPLEHVALVGDAEAIPTYFENLSGYHGEGDHPYTQLEGGDILADVHIGRISHATNAELELIVNKILGYEQTPYLDDPSWFGRACLVGDPSSSGISCVIVNQWMKERLLEIGYTDVDTVFTDPFVTNMRNSLNLGTSLMTYRGFIGMSGWQNSNTYALTNGWKMPFCVVMTCGTGNFAGGTARSEAFLRAGVAPSSPTAGIGAIGTATSGTHTRYNNCIFGGVLRGLYWEDQYAMGAALTRGKLEMYLNYNAVEPNEVAIWSHWNNLMGDPGVDVWTRYPSPVSVSHPASIALGTNSLAVTVQNVLPIADAQVCLWKDDETYVVGYTNANGEVELPISPDTAGNLLLTVTKPNQQPYLATIPVGTAGLYVGYKASEVDDDGVGTSNGNADGKANPGEAIELRVQLQNYGFNAVNGVTGTLSSNDPYVTITDDTEDFGDMASGATVWCADDFDVVIDPSCPHNHIIRLDLEIFSGPDQWHSIIDLPVLSADLVEAGLTLYDVGGNGILDPGETTTMSVELRNNGAIPADNVVGTLTSLSAFVSVLDGTGTFGTIPVWGIGENTVDRFQISASSDTYEGHLAWFLLVTEFSGGVLDTTLISTTVGVRSSDDPVGPDHYGYYAFDDTDTAYPEAPTFDWVEIDPAFGGDGTALNLSDFGTYQDDVKGVDLPFTIQYYGETYDRASICSNGWVAMGDTYLTNYRNWTIPGAGGPAAMVAPYWDNLRREGAADVFTKYDTANNRWIVQWSRMRNMANSSTQTFQAIFLDPAYHSTTTGDAMIIFQYHTVSNPDGVDGRCTVGIESPDQSDGILYTYFAQYPAGAATLQANRAIQFVPSEGGPLGMLSGTVTNASYGDAPLPGVEVTVMETGRSFETALDGRYGGSMSLGTFTLVAALDGFEPDTVYNVVVIEDQETVVDFSLVDIAGPAITTTPHPSTASTQGPYPIPITIVEYSGLAQSALFYRINYGAFVEEPLYPVSGNDYVGYIPGQPYTTVVQYYVYAQDGVGFESFDPASAPSELYEFQVAPEIAVLEDDFEADHGWTVGAPDDDASTGIWVREEPVGTDQGGLVVQPDTDHTPDPAEICFVTGNANPGEAAGTNDVDNGKTTLLSPVFDLGGFLQATVSYWVWFSNDRGSDPGTDYWDVDVTADGSTWAPLEHTTISTNAWVERSFNLDEHIALSDQVQLRFVAQDEGSGSLVEAAVDDFTLVGLGAVIDVTDADGRMVYGLAPAYPNPFNPTTNIRYSVGATDQVRLVIYDVAGRQVSTLVDGRVNAGEHTVRWDGRTDTGAKVASGTYFVRLDTPGFMQVRQLTLLK